MSMHSKCDVVAGRSVRCGGTPLFTFGQQFRQDHAKSAAVVDKSDWLNSYSGAISVEIRWKYVVRSGDMDMDAVDAHGQGIESISMYDYK